MRKKSIQSNTKIQSKHEKQMLWMTVEANKNPFSNNWLDVKQNPGGMHAIVNNQEQDQEEHFIRWFTARGKQLLSIKNSKCRHSFAKLQRHRSGTPMDR